MSTKEEINKIQDWVEDAIERGALVGIDTNTVSWIFSKARVALEENPKSFKRFAALTKE